MGSQSTRCCCKGDLEAEKVLEGHLKPPSTLVNYDHDAPLYEPIGADTFEGAFEGVGQNGYQEYEYGISDQINGFAPQPDGLSAITEASHEDSSRERPSSNGHKDALLEKLMPAPETTQPKLVESMPYSITDVPIEKKVEASTVDDSNDKVFGHPGKILQIHLDTGWVEFAEDDMKQINGHLKVGAEFFPITVRGAMYMLDFRDLNNITQTNPNTRKVRNLRLVYESDKHNSSHGPVPKEEITVTFHPGPIGLVHLPDGTVDEVIQGGQAEREGVKVGWRIAAVGTTKCESFTEKPFVDAQECGKSYTVTLVKAHAKSGEGQSKQSSGKCCVIS